MARELTTKQKVFVKEYIVDFNAAAAARRAGYSFKDKSDGGYYVYFLCDSRDGRIFYVGKGKGDRLKHHVKRYLKGTDNGAKDLMIKEILDYGFGVDEYIIEDKINEDDAFKLERYFIRKLRNYGITNIVDGVVTSRESEGKRALVNLSRMKPYPVWLNEIPEELIEVLNHVYGSLYDAYYSAKADFEMIAEVCGVRNET